MELYIGTTLNYRYLRFSQSLSPRGNESSKIQNLNW